MRIFFDQATGLPVQTIGYNVTGKEVMVIKTLRLQTSIDIAADRFALPRMSRSAARLRSRRRGLPTLRPLRQAARRYS